MNSDAIIIFEDEEKHHRSNALSEPILPPLLVSVDEAARLCSLSRSRMYELIAAGDVPSVTIGRSRRIPLDGLRSWVGAQVALAAARQDTP